MPGPHIGQLANTEVFLVHIKNLSANENTNMLIANTSAKKICFVIQLRAPEDFRVSSSTKKDSFQFISEQKNIKPLSYIADTSEVLKYCRNSNSLSKLKVMKQNVDRLHLHKP